MGTDKLTPLCQKVPSLGLHCLVVGILRRVVNGLGDQLSLCNTITSQLISYDLSGLIEAVTLSVPSLALDEGDHVRLAMREGTHRRLVDVVAHVPEALRPLFDAEPRGKGALGLHPETFDRW